MSALFILSAVIAYSLMLFGITWMTSRNANNASFFIGNKSSRWYVVAYGMIGASLSGVTFMSVPGNVGTQHFSYLLVVLGYFVGYIVIATVLIPLYYRLNVTSIYSYLEQRFGPSSYKTGALFFLLSRTIGASFRMFLVVNVLQIFVFDQLGVPFWITVASFIVLILLYTFEGGIKTIVWTDTLQTTFMLIGLIISVYMISTELHFDFSDLISTIKQSDYSQVIYTDWHDKRFFLKQFLSGIFITIAMTGLDQEMMQKNLSCHNIREAQKNMLSFSVVLVLVNLLFLALGAVLYLYCSKKNIMIPAKTDDLFPIIALKYLGPFAGLVFIIGLISAAYPSADGALTALTTSVCIDFLGFEKGKEKDEKKKKRIRYIVHFSFALLLLLTIVVFRMINDRSVVEKLFTIAGYTYGPLLGLFSFGLLLKRKVIDKYVPLICILSPLICYVLSVNSEYWFSGYQFGFELLVLNGMITFTGLFVISTKEKKGHE